MTELERKKKAMAYLIKTFPKKYRGVLKKNYDGNVTEIEFQEWYKYYDMGGSRWAWHTFDSIKMSEREKLITDEYKPLKLHPRQDFKIFVPFF